MITDTAVRIRPIAGALPRLLLPEDQYWEDLADYLPRGGYVRTPDAAEILELVREARLRGRGGAGFPTAVKLASVAEAEGPRCVVANGEEGEPASIKDRYLLRRRPHLVLDGLLLAARAVDADHAYVYVSDDASAASMRVAIAQRRSPVPVRIVTVPAGYVAGEASAVVRAIDGGPAKPTAKPPHPYQRGVGGMPTLIQNVETLAHLALLVSHGAAAHLEHGTSECTGTLLLTLSRPGGRVVLAEVPYGARLGDVVTEHLGPMEITGVVMGGFAGGIFGPEALDLPLTHEDVRKAGGMLGCGAVILLGPEDCQVSAAADIAAYFDRENAGQCGACIKGTDAMARDLAALASGTAGPDEVARIERLSASLLRRGSCGLLDAACATTASLVHTNRPLVDAHLAAPCPRCADATSPLGETRFRINW